MIHFKEGYYADVRIEDRFTTAIVVKNGALEEQKVISLKKAFIRVFDGAMWYYASTSDTDHIQEELDKLYVYATPNSAIVEHPIVKRYEVNRDEVILFANDCVKDIPVSEKYTCLKSICDQCKSEHLQMVNGRYLDRYSRFWFYSSKGSDITYDYQTTGLSIGMGFACGDEQFSDALQRAGVKSSDVNVTEEEIRQFIAECETYVTTAQPVVPGCYPVVLAPVATGVFAHESFGHKSEADFMLGDETMAREWQIGKKVGSDILSIYETGTLQGSGYTPYDDEGTKAGMTYLIKDGYLAGRLHSGMTAAYLDESLTGNARAINCDFEPIVRMTNTIVKGGSCTPEELIADIEHGYYIKDIKHGSGMSTFTIAPNLAYEIENGKIGKPVKIAVLTGNVFETLGLIDGVANDETVLSFVTGGCGKMEQYPLPVGLGGPHIRVSKMNLS